MAKVKFGSALPTYSEIDQLYDVSVNFVDGDKNHAVWASASDSSTITFEGKGLKYVQGVLVSGTVTKVAFEDVEGADFMTFKGEFKAEKLGQILDESSVSYLQEALLGGNDKVVGTSDNNYMRGTKGQDILLGMDGNDTLWGGAGKDHMTGGAGSDYFMFSTKSNSYPGDGHDVIVDFDAKGGGVNQDYIWDEANGVADIRKSGHDTVIEFTDGGTLTLLDVKRSDISDADFGAPL